MLLYSGPLSLFSRKVEIALHEKGLAAWYERMGAKPAVARVAVEVAAADRELSPPL